jgi:hypothetical protein
VTTGEQAFSEVADRLLRDPDVEEGTGFGSSPGLRVSRKIFAMLMSGELVVKLPADRCAELVADGVARPLERGQGRPMREWVVVADSARDRWPGLVDDALAYVRPAAD